MAKGNPERNPIAYTDTLLQYHLGIAHPELLTDEEWAEKQAILEHIRKKEAGK